MQSSVQKFSFELLGCCFIQTKTMEMIFKEVALIDNFVLDIYHFCNSEPARSSLRIYLPFVFVNTIKSGVPIDCDKHIASTQLFVCSLLRYPRQEMTMHVNRIVLVFRAFDVCLAINLVPWNVTLHSKELKGINM